MDVPHTPPARLISPSPAIVEDAMPITAGGYIKLRREAAERAAPGSLTIHAFAHLLAEAEAGRRILTDDQLDKLRSVVPLDPFIYQCLRDGIPAGRICTGCGCSWNDACTASDGRTCAWVSEKPEFCSACLLGDAVRSSRQSIAAETTVSTAMIDALRPFARAGQAIAANCPDDREMPIRFSAQDLRAAARALSDAGAL